MINPIELCLLVEELGFWLGSLHLSMDFCKWPRCRKSGLLENWWGGNGIKLADAKTCIYIIYGCLIVAMIIFVVPLMWYDGKRQQRRQQGKSSLRVGSKPVSKSFVGEDIGNLLLRFQATGRSAWEDTSMPKKRSLLVGALHFIMIIMWKVLLLDLKLSLNRDRGN